MVNPCARFYFVVLFLLALIPLESLAQTPETIQSDRPGQGSTPVVVGLNNFQIQSGWKRGGFNPSNNPTDQTFNTQQTFLRYGLSKRLELNTAINFTQSKLHLSENETFNSHLNDLLFGLRFNALTSKSGRPLLTITADYLLNSLYKKTGIYQSSTRILLSSAGSLYRDFSYLINFGGTYDPFFNQVTYKHVFNLSYAITNDWVVFAENYGEYNASTTANNWDYGLAYFINSNLQLDLFGAYKNNDQGTNYFVNAGFSWRIIN